MPFFADGQDPRDTPASPQPGRAPLGSAGPDPFAEAPTVSDTAAAAFRQNNPIVSVLDTVLNQSADHRVDPTHNPLETIKGTPLEQDPGAVLDSPNEATTRAIIAQRQKEDTDRQTIARSGWTGTIAGLGAGLIDPSYYLPIFGELHAAEGAASFGRSALRAAATGAGQSAVSEAALQASQQQRTWSESAGNIATNTLLMGLLGGAAGTLARPERAEAVDAMEAMRRDATPANPLDPASMSLHDHITPGESGLSQGVEQRAAELHAAGIGASPIEAAEAAHVEALPPEIAHEAYGPTAQESVRTAAERGGVSGEPDPTGALGEPGGGRGSSGGFGDGIDPADDIGAAERLAAGDGPAGDAVAGEPLTGIPPGPAQDLPAGGGFAAAGADVSDVRDLNLKSFGLEKVPGLGAANANLSPNLRVYSNSLSTAAKRAMADMAETALRFTQHDRGIATSSEGAIETMVRVQQSKMIAATHDILHPAWSDHRYGGAPPSAIQRGLDAVQDARGQTPDGKLSYKDFKAAVYDAMYSGDQHPIPQVQQAARDMRAKVYDPVAKMAQETLGPDGKPMLATELAPPAGDLSFVPRSWNKEAVIAKRYQLKQIITDWLAGEQATKAAAQERLSDIQSRHEEIGRQIDKLDRRLEALRGKQDETATRLKERGQARHETADRDDIVRERRGIAESSLAEVDSFISDLQGTLRDPALLQRLEELKAERTQLRSDLTGTEYTKLERAGIMHAETEELRSFQGGRETMSEAVDLARQDRAGARQRLRIIRARQDETSRAARANVGRIGLLQERLGRQQLMEDLLTAARDNAETEHTNLRSRMEGEVRAWKGDTAADAVASLKARDEAERIRGLRQEAGVYEGNGARLTSADGPVDRAVKRMLAGDRSLSRGELADRADEIIDQIIGSPDGRIGYDMASGGPAIGHTGSSAPPPRGSLQSRDFAIPTASVKDFVQRDLEHVTASHLRTILPDVQLTRRFGDVDMTNVFRRVQEDYARKIGPDTTEAQAKRINAQRDSDISDIAAVRDRLRGVYGWNPDPASRKVAAIVRDFRNANSLSSLGTSVANRFNDTGAQAVFRYGLGNVMHDAWRPFLKSMIGQSPLAGIAKKQAAEMGVGIDGLLGHLRHNLSDITESYQPGNKFSRGLAWANDRSMLVNLHGPWTDWMKAMAWVPAQAEFGRVADRIAAGSATKRDLATMADANIPPALAARISKQLADHSITVDGVRMASAGEWTDKPARDAFERAMAREANIAVITAGHGDKPLFLSKPIGGMLGQFKGFVAGAHERILLSNLQQRDGRTMQGALVSMAMGMMSYRLYTLLSGQQASDRPQDWIKEGLSRSAMTGWLSEANNTLSKFTAGKVDINRLYGADRPLSRRAENSPLSELLGPTYARMEGLTGIGVHALGGHFSAADIHQARMALPLQNLMGLRIGFDSLEDGIANSLGVKPRNHTPTQYPGGPTPYPPP